MGRLGTPTEQAYIRADQLDHRREVLDGWDTYVTSGETDQRARAAAKATLNAVADKSGRTVREVMAWTRDDDKPEHGDGMTRAEAAIWTRRDKDDE